MINNETKVRIVENGFDSLVRYVKREEYENYLYNFDLKPTYDFKSFFLCRYAEKNNISIEDANKLYLTAEKFVKNEYKRISTAKKRIKKLLNDGPCVFATLTFTNDALANTSQETRRRVVGRYLLSQSKYYIANIDFGSTNDREHYHAIIRADRINPLEWKYGALNVKRIYINNETALAKYINKLSAHSLKESTKNNRLIYSKELPRKETRRNENN